MTMSPCFTNCGNPMCRHQCNRAAFFNGQWGNEPISYLLVPDFEECANCGAGALVNVHWGGDGIGWACRACGATDGDG